MTHELPPSPVHRLEHIIAAFKALAESQQRFPRSRLELEILETLRQMYPLGLTLIQVTAMVRAPHMEVRTILQALSVLGTVDHRKKGYYRHRPQATGGEHG